MTKNTLKENKKRKRDFLTKKDKYRPQFCDESFYVQNEQNFFKIDQFIKHNSTLKYSSIESVVFWTVTLCVLRRKEDWFSGLNRENTFETLCENFDNFDSRLYADFMFASFWINELGVKWPSKLSVDLTFSQFLSQVQIKPLNRSIHSSFKGLYFKLYPVVLMDYEPSPLELLKIQCHGQRVLTFDSDFLNWKSKKYGHRDPLSFWLHDFIHAEHFFKNKEHFILQIGFYRWIYQCLEQKRIPVEELNDSFHDQFHYLISDMNSHPLHLVKTLRAILEIGERGTTTQAWKNFIEANKFNLYLSEAMLRVNSEFFNTNDYQLIMAYLESLGAEG